MQLRFDMSKLLPKKGHQPPKEYVIALGIIVAACFYVAVFLIDKPVVFSYAAGSACTRQLTILPDLHKADENAYRVQLSKPVKIGNWRLATLETCFIPKRPPAEGKTRVGMAPFGGWFMRKTFAIKVENRSVAQLASLDKPIPSSRPLTIHLDKTDRTFSYFLKAKKKQIECDTGDKVVVCDVKKLGLRQGVAYEIELLRMFHDTYVDIVFQKKIKTLLATNVVKTSIKQDETVYMKPRVIDVAFDKKIARVTPKLYKVEGKKRTLVATSTSIKNKEIKIKTTKDLPRLSDYELRLEELEATDGSSLEASYSLRFKLSGGPKVTGISIGTTGVPLGSTAVITFDQPLSDKQDIGGVVAVSGGGGVSGKSGNQVFVSLAGVPRCGGFSIAVSDKLQSNYDIAGGNAWKFNGRMICHTVSTFGYSSQGRAMNAYYFGNGPRTIMYTGAIHGNEISTQSLMLQWINDLEVNAPTIPADKTIVVVPTINPDGVAGGMRVNAHNVDLNRNFDVSDWQKDITTVTNQPFPGGGGPNPMSEPETQAIAALVQRLHPELVLSYHSIGGVVAGNQAGNSASLAATYAQLSGYSNVTGHTADTFDYSITGTADDWYAEKLGVPSVLIELSSHTYHQFSRNQRAMWTMLR